ncbi:MAG: methylmalonyl-CoA decarboxylase [Ignavibacteria bacterium]|nr:methylmalonyl-CoA decarboxylase [Ignavibacteria bacterium]
MNNIKTSFENLTCTIILDNSVKRNALSDDMLLEILDVMKKFKSRKARCLIIRAERGAKVFSAGYDISELAGGNRDIRIHNNPLEKVIRMIEYFPAPVIAMMEGSVWGEACELVFTCDILIGTSDTTFAITPSRLGVPYSTTGINHFLSMISIGIVKEMFFTAEPVNAERAYMLGILNHIVSREEIENFTYELGNIIVKNSPLTISVIKEQLRLLSQANLMTKETLKRIQELRNTVFESEDYREGINAFLEKREPEFKRK